MHIVDCARCGGVHERLVFRKLAQPVRILSREGEEVTFTHWAPCPANGDPILFRMWGAP